MRCWTARRRPGPAKWAKPELPAEAEETRLSGPSKVAAAATGREKERPSTPTTTAASDDQAPTVLDDFVDGDVVGVPTRGAEGRRAPSRGHSAGGGKRSDIVFFNVGGEVVATRRSTLLLARDSLFQTMFTGHWEDSMQRDAAGHIFLDYSPAPFRALLSYLRACRDAAPGEEVAKPVVPPEYEEEFRRMVSFLRLGAFLRRSSRAATAESLALRPDGDSASSGRLLVDGGLVTQTGRSPFVPTSVAGAHALLTDRGRDKRGAAAWKLRVLKLETHLVAGVADSSKPRMEWGDPAGSPACFGWFSYGVLLFGRLQPAEPGWPGWREGDVAIFDLDKGRRVLRMYHLCTRALHALRVPHAVSMAKLRVHLVLWGNTQVELSPANEKDLQEASFEESL